MPEVLFANLQAEIGLNNQVVGVIRAAEPAEAGIHHPLLEQDALQEERAAQAGLADYQVAGIAGLAVAAAINLWDKKQSRRQKVTIKWQE